MTQSQYQAQQLKTLLADLQNQQVNGTLYLDAVPPGQKRSRVLVFKAGRIMYGGSGLPNNQDFAKRLGQKLNPGRVDAAVSFALQKSTAQTSVQELLELLIKLRLFTWEQIETVVYSQVLVTLEQVLPYAGQFLLDSTTEFNVGRGWDWSQLTLDLNRRQEQWSTLAPLIPSMEAVPHLPANALQIVTDSTVHKHLQDWVNGQRSLVDVAAGLDKDPLQIAQSYLHWVQAGWVMFEGNTVPLQKLPTILAVDDSPVMQTLIRRALTEHYQVLVAGSATDALTLLNGNEVVLMLLDVTMPEMDGLDLCRHVRSLSQYRNLPIVMLTARDGFVDKAKGQIAGATQYLTKPFDPEKLRQIVEKYVGAMPAANPSSSRLTLTP